jgi:NADH-quinone oxidoreductase subunit N
VKLVLGLNALLLLILGLLPGGLMALCAESILQMMGT